jgi:hypothetical protein
MSIPRNNPKYQREHMHMRRTLPKYRRKQQAYDRLTQEMSRLTKRLCKKTDREYTIESCTKIVVSEDRLRQAFQFQTDIFFERFTPPVVSLFRRAFNENGALVNPGPEDIGDLTCLLEVICIKHWTLLKELWPSKELALKLFDVLVSGISRFYLVIPDTSKKRFTLYIIIAIEHQIFKEFFSRIDDEELELAKEFVRRAIYTDYKYRFDKERIWHKMHLVDPEKLGYEHSIIAMTDSHSFQKSEKVFFYDEFLEQLKLSWYDTNTIIPDSLKTSHSRGKHRELPEYLR